MHYDWPLMIMNQEVACESACLESTKIVSEFITTCGVLGQVIHG